MSYNAVISRKEAYPVRIGALLMYCEHFKAVGTRAFSEKSTVNGNTFFSNTNKKSMRLTFEGRIYDDYFPLRMLNYTDGLMTADSVCTVEYRGITFAGCRVQAFTAEDKGDDYIYASISLVTPERSAKSPDAGGSEVES